MANYRIKLILIAICFASVILIEGRSVKQRHHHHNYQSFHNAHKNAEQAQSRSYIDIDASDPFKVPKSSQYIDQPVPEFTRQQDDKEDKEDREEKEEPEEEHAPENDSDHGPENGPDDSNPDNVPIKSFDNIQDDLKKMGLEKYANNNNNIDDSNKSIDSQDGQPIIEQENSNADPSKPIEIGDVDQSLKGLGDSSSRHNLPNGDNDEEQRDEQGYDRNDQN